MPVTGKAKSSVNGSRPFVVTIALILCLVAITGP